MKLTTRLARALLRSLPGEVLAEALTAPGQSIFAPSPTAGMRVDADSALALPAFWACVRYVSSQVAMLPWGPYRTTPGGGRKEQREHRLWAMLHEEPAPLTTPMVLKEALVWNALVVGNGYAEVVGDTLLLHESAIVTPLVDGQGALSYAVGRGQDTRTVLAADMFHLRGPSRDGRVGLSVIGAAREGLGLGLAVQTYAAAFFGNGSHVGGVYQTPGVLSQEQYERLLAQIEADRGARAAHRPRILEGGLTYQADTIPPQDAQYIETRQFGAREICSLFGVPPHKIGLEGGATAYASREQAAIEAVMDCLMPWVVRLEQEANIKLLTPTERRAGYYTHLNVDGLLRGDAQSRAGYYEKQIRNAGMTPNEQRALEERDAVPGGDELMVSRDLIPVGSIREYAESQIVANEAKAGAALSPMRADYRERLRRRKALTAEEARRILAPLAQAHRELAVPFDLDGFIDDVMGGSDADTTT